MGVSGGPVLVAPGHSFAPDPSRFPGIPHPKYFRGILHLVLGSLVSRWVELFFRSEFLQPLRDALALPQALVPGDQLCRVNHSVVRR